MPIQISCPSCSRPLRVPDTLVGKNVKCPSCTTTFVASTGEEAPPVPPPIPAETAPRRSSGYREINAPTSEARTETMPPPPPARDDDDPDQPARPSRRPRRDEFDDDDDDFDRPSRRRRRRPSYDSHRAGTVMTVGLLSIILSLVICPLVGLIGFAAFAMGKRDLAEMEAGRMDPDGHGQTKAGYVMGIIGGVIGILTMVGIGFLVLLAAVK